MDDMIYSKAFSKKSFNIDVADRGTCMQALLRKDETYVLVNESSQNMLDRYQDIEDIFPDELKGEALPYFINWLIEKVLLLEVDTPSDDEAHTIFLTMNDRGLSLNSAEIMKAYIIRQVAEADRIEVNRKWQDNINRIKNASSYDTSGMVNTQDVEFISIWLRTKYANSMQDTKRGAKDEDYELLGDKFHTWVVNNARTAMGLVKSKDYKEFVLIEMTRVTDVYLLMKGYGSKLTPGTLPWLPGWQGCPSANPCPGHRPGWLYRPLGNRTGLRHDYGAPGRGSARNVHPPRQLPSCRRKRLLQL